MREFELVIDEALKKGLTPEEFIPTNAQFLYECLGFRCGKGGLEVHEPLTNPLPSTLVMYYSWPFPQLITGEGYAILVVRNSTTQLTDTVYVLSEDHLTVTQVFIIDKLTFGLGGLMEVADFGEFLFMTNGVVMVYWNPVASAWNAMTSSPTLPMLRTVCNFKGQLIGGGVLSSWYDCDDTSYAWSEIGNINFTPSQNNEAGYRHCPYGGSILHVRRLGDYAIGYSSKGITKIQPIKEPATTMGFEELSNIGLINQGALATGDDKHLFVGEDYILREISLQGNLTMKYKVVELGYKFYLEQLAGEDIIVTYDPSLKNFYIGNSIKTFLLSPYGLTEVMQHPSAVWRRNKLSYMLPDDIDPSDYTISTIPFDMGYRGHKTITSMESDSFGFGSSMLGADYTMDQVNWFTGPTNPVNAQGIASPIIAGNQFRLKFIAGLASTGARISYIKARYKMTDMRGIRGIYAPGIRGQQRGVE